MLLRPSRSRRTGKSKATFSQACSLDLQRLTNQVIQALGELDALDSFGRNDLGRRGLHKGIGQLHQVVLKEVVLTLQCAVDECVFDFSFGQRNHLIISQSLESMSVCDASQPGSMARRPSELVVHMSMCGKISHDVSASASP